MMGRLLKQKKPWRCETRATVVGVKVWKGTVS